MIMANNVDSSKKVNVCVRIANTRDDYGVGPVGNCAGMDHGVVQTRDGKVDNADEEMEEEEEMHETKSDLEDTLLERDTKGKMMKKIVIFMILTIALLMNQMKKTRTLVKHLEMWWLWLENLQN